MVTSQRSPQQWPLPGLSVNHTAAGSGLLHPPASSCFLKIKVAVVVVVFGSSICSNRKSSGGGGGDGGGGGVHGSGGNSNITQQ